MNENAKQKFGECATFTHVYMVEHLESSRTIPKPLEYLKTIDHTTTTKAIGRIKLDDHEYEIKYNPGHLNLNADALSGNSIRQETQVSPLATTRKARLAIAKKNVYTIILATISKKTNSANKLDAHEIKKVKIILMKRFRKK